MPNIFGREAHDYRHYAALRENGFTDAAITQGGRLGAHDFNALAFRDRSTLNDQEIHAQSIHFLTNNLQAIQAEIEEILYLDFRLDEFIPMKTDVPEGARTYSYRVVDRHGTGSFIENLGTNAQSAQVGVQNVPYSIEYGGILPEWSLEDLRVSSFAGIPLDTEIIRAASEGAMDHIEQVGIVGDSTKDFLGITNLSGPTTTTAARTFAASTGDQLVSDIQAQIRQIVSGTQEIFGRVFKSTLAIYLPIAQADILSNLPYGDNRYRSVWEYLSVNNLWTQYTGKPLEMRIVAELAGAGASNSDRYLLGFPDESRVWEMAMPISPRVITTLNKGFSICAPMEYKISGLNEKRTQAMRYVDGI